MALTAFNCSGRPKRAFGTYKTFRSTSNGTESVSITADKSGKAVVAAAGWGYFKTSLKKNGTEIASSQWQSPNFPHGGWEAFAAGQYGLGFATISFDINKGDVVSFEGGPQGDAGTVTNHFVMYIFT